MTGLFLPFLIIYQSPSCHHDLLKTLSLHPGKPVILYLNVMISLFWMLVTPDSVYIFKLSKKN